MNKKYVLGMWIKNRDTNVNKEWEKERVIRNVNIINVIKKYK